MQKRKVLAMLMLSTFLLGTLLPVGVSATTETSSNTEATVETEASLSSASSTSVSSADVGTPSSAQDAIVGSSSTTSSSQTKTSESEMTETSVEISENNIQNATKEIATEQSSFQLEDLLAQTSSITAETTTVSIARGDDYPYKHIPFDQEYIDPWRLFHRQCTSFVAWRLQEVNGFRIPNAYGNANAWAARASREGYRVDKTPALGSVAAWTVGQYGHISWVSAIYGSAVEIEEYNYGFTGNYAKRVIPISAVESFIHFKDVSLAPPIVRYNTDQVAAESGQSVSDGDYQIVAQANPGLALDIAGREASNSANLQLWETNQTFTVTHLGGGYYKIINKHTGKSIDVSGASMDRGANVHQWEYVGANQQQWILKPTGDGQSFEIVSRHNGLVLDITTGNIVQGANIQMHDPNGSAAQKFRFVSVDTDAGRTIADGNYHIVSKLDNSFGLDLDNNNSADTTNIQLYQNSYDQSQLFTVRYLDNGYYVIEDRDSGKRLDVYYDRYYNGSNVSIHSANDSDAQQWLIRDTGDGYYEILSKHKNMSLDAAGGAASNGLNVHLWIRHGGDNQRWKFLADIPVYRLYSASKKQYFYTKNLSEVKNLKARGWQYEGRSFTTAATGTPVYRLYNASRKTYAYTSNAIERDNSVRRGWKYEGVAWYSAGNQKVYRLFNSQQKVHVYTRHESEVHMLKERGWKYEGIGFYTIE